MTQAEFSARLAVIRDRATEAKTRLDVDATPSANAVADVIEQLDTIITNADVLQGVTIQP